MVSTRSCIEQQLNEIELLRCCYSSADEFTFDDVDALNEAKDFCDEKHDHLQRNLSFVLKLRFQETKVRSDRC
jgi:hypothetical protein